MLPEMVSPATLNVMGTGQEPSCFTRHMEKTSKAAANIGLIVISVNPIHRP